MSLRTITTRLVRPIRSVPSCSHAFTNTATAWKAPNPPRPTVDESEIEEKFLHGSGPGGQKSTFSSSFQQGSGQGGNKTSSAVQLRHIPTGIVVKSQETRSRIQNRSIARKILAEKLDDLKNGEKSRSAIVGEKVKKKKASAKKKTKRKYAKLNAAEKAASELEDGEEEEDDVDSENVEEDGSIHANSLGDDAAASPSIEDADVQSPKNRSAQENARRSFPE